MNERQTVEQKVGQRRRETLEKVSPMYRSTYVKAYEGNSRAAAIRAFCLYCTGDQRNEIGDCTSYACPLREYRPYQEGDATSSNEDASQD